MDKLTSCDDLKSAAAFLWKRWPSRHAAGGGQAGRCRFQTLETRLKLRLADKFRSASFDWRHLAIDDYPSRSLVRRELYAWNLREPDRCSDESVRYLNAEMARCAPKLEVKVTELQDLAFASIE